jgi:hypothetical protein
MITKLSPQEIKQKELSCMHQYLPDEDGVAYNCGSNEDLYLVDNIEVLCDKHMYRCCRCNEINCPAARDWHNGCISDL